MTKAAAWGGVLLFVSALGYVAVVVGTWLGGRRTERPAFEFAVPLQAPAWSVWERLGAWTIVAVVLVGLAYAYPLAHLLALPRFGSPPFEPF